MTTDSSFADERPRSFDPAKVKSQRAEDAEKIRQDFIKSRHLELPPAIKKSSPETNADE
jgi:hypothetical protein